MTVEDDFAPVRERLRELELERQMAADVDMARGEWLDMHAARAGLSRGSGESDDSLRTRIRKETS